MSCLAAPWTLPFSRNYILFWPPIQSQHSAVVTADPQITTAMEPEKSLRNGHNRLQVLPVFENLDERAGAQFVGGEAGEAQGFGFGERAGVGGAEEVVEEALTRGGVVEHVADEGGLGGLLDEVAEALGGGVESFEEEGVDGGVAGGELRGVQVPALIEAAGERVADVREVEPPRAVDGAAVLVRLFGRELLAFGGAVRGDGHDVGRAV